MEAGPIHPFLENTEDILNIRYRSLAKDWLEPRESHFWSAHFSFSSAKVLKEVPYDPSLLMLFFGEEILMTVRLYTHGWDLFSPAGGRKVFVVPSRGLGVARRVEDYETRKVQSSV
eukprot:g30680.t1